ncbi:MAG: Tad secretion system pilus assembly protein TadZ [Saliniramus fredricksonii]|uniref:Pilus assembly protein CpaE n=1 Tax=Saliniramus fredricksonii TaxID=1653334 RepID=A0A0P7XBP8_9HYPH|nr:AAA family ATPase [Saliniramus fredricksonii]KPQ12779.1 MAG: Tad secretion system pilus assembly protein TadZ [Saliniramus fredricksonii]SCC82545.1 pilus assembly protein CpaE [Saliniramus fredricksonii]
MSHSEDDMIAPVPRVTIQAFCDSPDIATALESAATDRRMQKAHLRVQAGGAAGAVAAFAQAPTPNVIILEVGQNEQAQFLRHLDELSEVCDTGTRVLVVGHVNDVLLYRDLIRRGVSDYLIAPLSPVDMVRAVSGLFTTPGSDPVGRIVAVIGAKGGVGASTVAHNLAWSFSRDLDMATVVADLDIAFGTAGLDFNQDPPQGIAEAIFAPDRLDANVVDRLMSKCSDKLSLLAAPAVLDRTCDLTETTFDQLLDLLRANMPCIVLDVPHLWSAWTKRILLAADDIIVVAEPELASLRNAKNLADLLRQQRPNDRPPRLMLNRIGLPKRPEISSADFAKAVGHDLDAQMPFDAQLFGSAANNGQMLAELQPGCRPAEIFTELAATLIGRTELKNKRAGLLDPLLSKFLKRKSAS